MQTSCFYNIESKKYFLEIKPQKHSLEWLEKIAIENNCRIEKKEWRSKYNSYVVYDYEPFCSDIFEISITISSNVYNDLLFLEYLYSNREKTNEYLKDCLCS